MKYLFFTLLLISSDIYAENWLNHSKILTASKEAFSLKAECERISQEKCFDLGDYPSSVYSEIDVEVDDTSKPVFSKNDVQSCQSSEECEAIHVSKVCSNGESSIKNLELMQVYCSKFLSYDKKTIKSIGLDQTKLAAYNFELQNKASIQAKESAIAYAQKLMACGQRVMAYMLVRNQPKQLSTSQVDLLVQTYAPIKALLETGSLTTAAEKIQAVVADGVVVTEADKTALVNEINSCKGN